MVTTLEVIRLVERWSKKYDVEKDVVTILHADLKEDELKLLLDEKVKNRKANTADEKKEKTYARADKGKQILEEKLKNHIESEYKNVKQKTTNMPFQISWDYFGEF
jgi:arsenate reductase-like glutaredoxin family protein